MSIREYIHKSIKNIYPPEEYRNISNIVCRDILHLSELDIYTGKYINLSEENRNLLENCLNRLSKSEPIQYIIGTTEFMGLKFRVAPGVLIPRPETEELTNLIIKQTKNKSRIVDIGTGSGCIAVSLAKYIPDAQVEGWDISPAALEIAEENSHRLNTKVVFRQEDILKYIPSDRQFDIIVSNPPYITEKEKNHMDRNVLEWEPGTALFVPDNDPLLFYRKIAKSGRFMLAPEGKIYFEINRSYGKKIVELLLENDYQNVQLIKDLYGNDRMVVATL